MAARGIDFRFSNNADWSYGFSCQRFGGGIVPWLGTPVRVAGGAYGPGSAVVEAGDLYLADPKVVTTPFTGALTIAADVAASGASRWLLIGRAADFSAIPYNFTGAEVTCAIAACNAAGDILDPTPKLRVGSGEGTLAFTNRELGGLAFTVPRRRVRNVTAGLYRYDILASYPQGPVRRVRYGILLVDQGISA